MLNWLSWQNKSICVMTYVRLLFFVCTIGTDFRQELKHQRNVIGAHTLAEIMHSYQAFDCVGWLLSHAVLVRLQSLRDEFDFIIKSNYFEKQNIQMPRP